MRPHNKTLVLTLQIANCKVSRILVDNESLTNILFLATLGKMEINKREVEKSTIFLVWFKDQSTEAVNTMHFLLVHQVLGKARSL